MLEFPVTPTKSIYLQSIIPPEKAEGKRIILVDTQNLSNYYLRWLTQLLPSFLLRLSPKETYLGQFKTSSKIHLTKLEKEEDIFFNCLTLRPSDDLWSGKGFYPVLDFLEETLGGTPESPERKRYQVLVYCVKVLGVSL